MQQSSILDERLLKTPLIRNSLLPEGPAVIPPDIVSKCESLHLTDIKTSTVTETFKPKVSSYSNSEGKKFKQLTQFPTKILQLYRHAGHAPSLYSALKYK